MNVMMLLEMAQAGHADRVALVCDGESLSFAELFDAAGAAAGEIAAAGVERVALLDVTSPAFPVALFASAWAGVPFAPLNYRLTGAELEALLARVAPALLVAEDERAASLTAPGIRVVPRSAFLSGARAGAERPAEWSMDPEEIAVLLFTSGTTGAPKAALLRHRHLVSYILGSVEFGSADADDATLVSVPPYHVAGIAATLSSVYAGRRIAQLPNFAPDAWIDLAAAARVTHAFVVPTMLARIVDALEARDGLTLPALRALSYGGGRMPLVVIERAMELLPGAAFTNAYGLTETSSTIALLGPEDHRAAAASDDPAVRRRLSSAGQPLPGVELEIRDGDGKPVQPGVRGEIHVRGEQVSGEYLGRGPTKLAGGWFPTRDGGWLDEDGYLYVEGRVDDVIVRGGENLSPGEIEDVLLEHPAVRECAVVGVPDREWGEAVAACVVLRAGRTASDTELQGFVRERLRSSRTPERIVFRDELPYNETGKLLRRIVRAQLADDSR